MIKSILINETKERKNKTKIKVQLEQYNGNIFVNEKRIRKI